VVPTTQYYRTVWWEKSRITRVTGQNIVIRVIIKLINWCIQKYSKLTFTAMSTLAKPIGYLLTSWDFLLQFFTFITVIWHWRTNTVMMLLKPIMECSRWKKFHSFFCQGVIKFVKYTMFVLVLKLKMTCIWNLNLTEFMIKTKYFPLTSFFTSIWSWISIDKFQKILWNFITFGIIRLFANITMAFSMPSVFYFCIIWQWFEPFLNDEISNSQQNQTRIAGETYFV